MRIALLGCLAFGVALGACEANLANPQDFADRSEFSSGGSAATNSAGASSSAAGTGANAGASSMGGSSGAAIPPCVTAIFTTTCAGNVCHSAGANPAGGLDLVSPNVADRLVDRPALHSDVGPKDVCPQGDKLIDTSNRPASWLLEKLSPSSVGTCGTRMPAAGNLTSIQLSCLQNWIDVVEPGGT